MKRSQAAALVARDLARAVPAGNEVVLNTLIAYGHNRVIRDAATIELWCRQHPDLVSRPVRVHARHGFAWKARSERGSCLHEHRSEAAAQRCCDLMNRPTPATGTPQGAYDHAAGYPD